MAEDYSDALLRPALKGHGWLGTSIMRHLSDDPFPSGLGHSLRSVYLCVEEYYYSAFLIFLFSLRGYNALCTEFEHDLASSKQKTLP